MTARNLRGCAWFGGEGEVKGAGGLGLGVGGRNGRFSIIQLPNRNHNEQTANDEQTRCFKFRQNYRPRSRSTKDRRPVFSKLPNSPSRRAS